MTINRYKAGNDANNREIVVPSKTDPGTIIVEAESGIIWVTLTASGDSTITRSVIGGGSITLPNGGVGNKPLAATAARDGSFLYPIVGAVDGETVGGTGTAKGTPVYLVAGGKSVTLTGTPGTDTFVGNIDDCAIVDGVGAIEIGAK